MKRRIEFIDTPGLDDKILELLPDNTQPLRIEDDPQIQSLFEGEERQDLTSISAYIIVYSEEHLVTKIMASQLMYVLTVVYEEAKTRPIWVVENHGNIPRIRQVIRRDTPPDLKRNIKSIGGFFKVVDIKTGDGIEEMLDHIAKTLRSKIEMQKLFPRTMAQNDRRPRNACKNACAVM